MAEQAELFDDALVARADDHYRQGRELVDSGHPELALEHIEAARGAYAAAGDQVAALRTDLGRMHVLDDLGRHDETVAVGRSLIRAIDEVAAAPRGGDAELVRYVRAAAAENTGVALGFLGQHSAALATLADALRRYAEMGDAGDLARCNTNLGVELLESGRAREAIVHFDAAVEQFLSIGETGDAATCLSRRSRAEVLLGEHLAALRSATEAELALDTDNRRPERDRAAIARAGIYLGLNLAHEAMGGLASVIESVRSSGHRRDLADALLIHGRARVALGQAHRAADEIDEAVAIYAEIGAIPSEAAALLARADAAEAADDAAGADHALGEAMERIDPDLHPLEYVAIALQLSHRRPGAARQLIGDAACVAETLGVAPLLWRARAATGRLLAASGNTGQAVEALREAVALVEDERSKLPTDMLRSGFLIGRADVYQDLIEVLIDVADPDALREVAAVSDRATTGTVSDILARVALPATAKAAPRARLQADLGALYDAMLSAPDVAKLGQLRSEAQRVESELGRLRTVAHTEHAHRDHAGNDATTASTADVLVCEASGRLVAVVDPAAEPTLVDLCAVDDVSRLLDELDASRRHVRLLGDSHGPRLLDASVAVLHELYGATIGRIESSIADRDGLAVSATGIASRIPYHALHDGSKHLVETRAVVQQPAVVWRARPRVPVRHVLTIGAGDDSTKAVEHELAAVAACYATATRRWNTSATADALFTDQAEADAIHYAGHGLHRQDNPLFSSLKFFDRWLSAWEVFGMALRPGLVVLAGCDTARPMPGRPEPLGLSQAFLAAGARNVVASLWTADDAATMELMVRFHQRIRAGEGAPEALRGAQIDAIEAGRNPQEWASFAVFGAR